MKELIFVEYMPYSGVFRVYVNFNRYRTRTLAFMDCTNSELCYLKDVVEGQNADLRFVGDGDEIKKFQKLYEEI